MLGPPLVAHGGVCFGLQGGKSCISPMRGSMSNYHDYHAEEMEDDYDYDMDDPVDGMVDEHQERGFRDSDSDDDDDYVRSVCFPFILSPFMVHASYWVSRILCG